MTALDDRQNRAPLLQMTDSEVIEVAEAEGLELCWRLVGGKLCVGFVVLLWRPTPRDGESRLQMVAPTRGRPR